MMYSNFAVDGYSRGGMWHGFGGGYDGFGPLSFLTFGVFSVFAVIALIWVIGIKGYSLWVSARRGEKWWFIALLVINTLGLLELVYLIFFAKVFAKSKIGKAMSETAAAEPSSSSHAAHHPHEHKAEQAKKEGEEGQ